jgi:hypothetical protein
VIDVNLLSLPGALGQLVLKWGTAKYIEAAGASADILSRAQAVKAIATEIDGVALGTVTVAQLQAMAATELASKGLKTSDQILVGGLMQLIGAALPAANAGLLSAAVSAEANLVLQDIIAVCTSFGA